MCKTSRFLTCEHPNCKELVNRQEQIDNAVLVAVRARKDVVSKRFDADGVWSYCVFVLDLIVEVVLEHRSVQDGFGVYASL